MVKSIAYTIAAILLSLGFFVWEDWFLQKECDELYTAIDSLYEKTEEQIATREDVYAVRTLWQNKKCHLHIFVPHNDLSQLDYRLNEACGLIYNKHYDFALSSLEVLREMTKNLPDSYNLKLENIL